jgi:thiamine biosynthesis lipoprotein
MLSREVHEKSDGAFDVTVGPLMKEWGFHGGSTPGPPGEAVQRELGERVGFQHVALDERQRTIRFLRPGMRLDFGAVAKGFALDRAAAVLEEAGVRAALLHGGTSTVLALGAPPGEDAWNVAIKAPGAGAAILRVVALERCALSVSAPHGRAFEKDGAAFGHVMDPRIGAPAASAALCAVVCASAARADAWSTALLAAGPDRFEARVEAEPDLTALLCRETKTGMTETWAGRDPGLFQEPGARPDDSETPPRKQGDAR